MPSSILPPVRSAGPRQRQQPARRIQRRGGLKFRLHRNDRSGRYSGQISAGFDLRCRQFRPLDQTSLPSEEQQSLDDRQRRDQRPRRRRAGQDRHRHADAVAAQSFYFGGTTISAGTIVANHNDSTRRGRRHRRDRCAWHRCNHARRRHPARRCERRSQQCGHVQRRQVQHALGGNRTDRDADECREPSTPTRSRSSARRPTPARSSMRPRRDRGSDGRPGRRGPHAEGQRQLPSSA